MMQPLKSNAELGTGNAGLEGVARFRVPPSAFRVGLVAANIPMANRSLPQPASLPGTPVARSSRARP